MIQKLFNWLGLSGHAVLQCGILGLQVYILWKHKGEVDALNMIIGAGQAALAQGALSAKPPKE